MSWARLHSLLCKFSVFPILAGDSVAKLSDYMIIFLQCQITFSSGPYLTSSPNITRIPWKIFKALQAFTLQDSPKPSRLLSCWFQSLPSFEVSVRAALLSSSQHGTEALCVIPKLYTSCFSVWDVFCYSCLPDERTPKSHHFSQSREKSLCPVTSSIVSYNSCHTVF